MGAKRVDRAAPHVYETSDGRALMRSELQCPHCGFYGSGVVDSRARWGGESSAAGVRRRRECQKCGGRFTTLERVIDAREEAEILRLRTLAACLRGLLVESPQAEAAVDPIGSNAVADQRPRAQSLDALTLSPTPLRSEEP
jgi:hypothetical protein